MPRTDIPTKPAIYRVMFFDDMDGIERLRMFDKPEEREAFIRRALKPRNVPVKYKVRNGMKHFGM